MWKFRPGDVSLLLQLLLDLAAHLFSGGVHLSDLGEEGSNLITAEEACSSALQHVAQASLNCTWEWKRRKDGWDGGREEEYILNRAVTTLVTIYCTIHPMGFQWTWLEMYFLRKLCFLWEGGFFRQLPQTDKNGAGCKTQLPLATRFTGWCWSCGKYFSSRNRTNNMLALQLLLGPAGSTNPGQPHTVPSNQKKDFNTIVSIQSSHTS